MGKLEIAETPFAKKQEKLYNKFQISISLSKKALINFCNLISWHNQGIEQVDD